jgi:hypothetical protein
MKTKTIAPRLLSGKVRQHWGGGLPPEVKREIRRMAVERRESVSWMMEQIILEYFGIKVPEYITRKPRK